MRDGYTYYVEGGQLAWHTVDSGRLLLRIKCWFARDHDWTERTDTHPNFRWCGRCGRFQIKAPTVLYMETARPLVDHPQRGHDEDMEVSVD